MAFSSSTVSIGFSTKKSDYDRLMNNTQYNKAGVTRLESGTVSFQGIKTFQSGTVFEIKPKADGIQTLSATGSVSIECEHVDGSAVHSVVNCKTKILEIGAWNMDSTSSVDITHGLSVRNIVSVSGILFVDPEYTVFAHLFSGGSVNVSLQAVALVQETYVTVSRYTGGFFDSVQYDSTAINRGYIYIKYIE